MSYKFCLEQGILFVLSNMDFNLSFFGSLLDMCERTDMEKMFDRRSSYLATPFEVICIHNASRVWKSLSSSTVDYIDVMACKQSLSRLSSVLRLSVN